jgi:hypothetical protein
VIVDFLFFNYLYYLYFYCPKDYRFFVTYILKFIKVLLNMLDYILKFIKVLLNMLDYILTKDKEERTIFIYKFFILIFTF